LLHPLVALETDSGLLQAFCGCCDVRDLPAEDCAVGGWKFLGHSEAQHDAVGIEDECEWRLFGDEVQAQGVLIETFCAGYVDDAGEGDDVVVGEAEWLRHGMMMSLFSDCRKNAFTP
jgi:hypothetical protein